MKRMVGSLSAIGKVRGGVEDNLIYVGAWVFDLLHWSIHYGLPNCMHGELSMILKAHARWRFHEELPGI